MKLTRNEWIEKYGGQALLDAEGFDVVPCVDCDDSVCHGWRVTPKLTEMKWAGEMWHSGTLRG